MRTILVVLLGLTACDSPGSGGVSSGPMVGLAACQQAKAALCRPISLPCAAGVQGAYASVAECLAGPAGDQWTCEGDALTFDWSVCIQPINAAGCNSPTAAPDVRVEWSTQTTDAMQACTDAWASR